MINLKYLQQNFSPKIAFTLTSVSIVKCRVVRVPLTLQIKCTEQNT